MSDTKENILVISVKEQNRRLARIFSFMERDRISCAIISDNANIYYLTGRVFSGYILLTSEGMCYYFVKRPNNLCGDNVIAIRKPEQMAEYIDRQPVGTIALELDSLSYSEGLRLKAISPERELKNLSAILRKVRAVKTKEEQELIKRSGILQEKVYREIPRLYRPGMTDLDFQLEIEMALRKGGCLGQFRISGSSMEFFMGNILTGDNADNPTPYDFAMGGAGAHPSLPVGANGTEIKQDTTVMVDANGNFTGYMTDMTRTFAVGDVSPLARKAHLCSINICKELARIGLPGTEAKILYEQAVEMAAEESLTDYFMGHRQKAGFVGHGVGIEINELPVIAPRSRDILTEGNVIALEPKFVIPGVGAVGIENTYIVSTDGMHCVTNAPEEFISL